MGILDFKFKTNFMHELEHPVLFVAKKNKTLLSPISIYESFNPTFRFNGFQEVSFEVYREVNRKRQDCYDYLEDGRYLFVQGVCWYEMHVEESNDGTGWKKSVSATSLESMLSKKNLVDFECNTGEILYDDYVKTIFYDPTNHKGSLLHRVLDVCPAWTIGHVDASLQNKQRSFDVSSQDVYSFLTNDVSEAFNCIFLFDTFNYTVNAYDLDNYGKDSNIFVSMENLAENMTISIEENSIFTCYRVYGGDGVYINEVNPNGTNKIYNFDYYLDEMDENLRSKILGYKELRSSLIDDYESVMLRMQECVDKILEYENRVPESFMSKDWTEYGLSMLKTQKDSRVNIDEMYKAQKMNTPSSIYYEAYLENKTELEEIKKEIEVRQEEIDEQYAIYDEMKYERDELQDKMSMSEWFTVDEWKQLDAYVIEETYTNDNYIVTDLEDDAERFDIERQLLKVATEDLQKKSRPQYQYSGTLLNLLSIPGLENFAEYFSLGNFIFSETSFGEKIKLRLIEFSIDDYGNQETINVTFSDATRVKDVYEDTASIISQANSASLSFKFNKTQYDKASKEGDYVANLRKYGLDVAKTRIHNSTNQNQVWDSSGMTFREWNDQKQDYNPEQMKIINNLLVFTDDSGETFKTALGKIYMGNQEYAWGLNAEVLLGKLVMSEQLYVENESGTFKIEDKGFSATKGNNTVKIQPGEEKLFSITKGNADLFYLDDKGNLHFKGDLTGSSGTFSGTLKGVDGTFSGTLEGVNGTFGGLISGGSINIGNGSFIVDKDGDFSIAGGDITYSNDKLSFSNRITLGWANLPSNVASSSDIPSDYQITEITKDTIKTANIIAQNLKVKAANIEGTVYADSVSANSSIESPTIFSSSHRTYDSTENGFYLSSDGLSLGRNFKVDPYGNLTCYSADISGEIKMGNSLKLTANDYYYVNALSVQTGSYDKVEGDENGIMSSIGYLDYLNPILRIGDGQNGIVMSSHTTFEQTIGCESNIILKNGAKLVGLATKSKYLTGSAGDVHVGSQGLIPNSSGSMNLGASSYKYSDVYATNGTIQTSDRNEKKSIEALNEKHIALFERLIPVSFQFVDGTSGRTHIGFISQDVEDAMKEVGLSDLDFAGFCKDEIEDEDGNVRSIYGLRYSEFIAINTMMIQKTRKDLLNLKDEISSMKSSLIKNGIE